MPSLVLVNYLNNDPEMNVDFKIHHAVGYMVIFSRHPEGQLWTWAVKLFLPLQNEALSLCDSPLAPCDSFFFSAHFYLSSSLGCILECNLVIDNHEIQWINISYFLLIQRLIFRKPWYLEQVISMASTPPVKAYGLTQWTLRLFRSLCLLPPLINKVWRGKKKKLSLQQYLGEATDSNYFVFERKYEYIFCLIFA